MQDLFLLLGTVMFLAMGFVAPFVMSLGYMWVDVFTPQDVSGSLLSGQPLAFIFGVCAMAAYFLLDRRERPKLSPVTVLQLLIFVWITLTLQWAVAPAAALWRWDLASKVCLFAAFLPYVIRSRVQIEACVLVYVFAICGHIVPWGIKTFITGGGYNQSLGLLRVNSNLLAESSSVSGIAVMIVPLLLVMRRHSLLLPRHWITTAGVFGVIVVALVGAIGTFARTALVAFAVGGTSMWLRSKRKVLFLAMSLIMAAIMFSVTSDRWTERISTISEYESEGSALVRLLVWRWSWEFAQSHPFGGGFWAFTTNRIEIPSATGGAPLVQFGRAYHNIYFGVLADQGYVGLALYLAMVALVLHGLQKTRKQLRGLPQHDWCVDLAQALQVSLVTMLAVGMFVEIGWTPIVWYLFSIAVCVRAYARRVVTPAALSGGDATGTVRAAEVGQPAFGRDAPALSGRMR